MTKESRPASNTDSTVAATSPDHQSPEPVRSESLLPADEDPDGRFAVAEEVSLDQQSDSARKVGTLPDDPAPGASLPDALAASLAPGAAAPPLDPDTLPPVG